MEPRRRVGSRHGAAAAPSTVQGLRRSVDRGGNAAVGVGGGASRCGTELLDRHDAPQRTAARDARVGRVDRRGVLLRERPQLREVPEPRCEPCDRRPLESGEETVILEGRAEPVVDGELERRVDEVYGPKYDFTPDSAGEADPWFVVRPQRAYAWTERGYPGSATQFDFD